MEHVDFSRATKIIKKKRRSRRDMSDERCLMVQGNDSLEVQLETQLDASTSSYCYGCLEVQTINVELATKCENFFGKI